MKTPHGERGAPLIHYSRRSRQIYVRARTDPQSAQLWWPGPGAALNAPIWRGHNNVKVFRTFTEQLTEMLRVEMRIRQKLFRLFTKIVESLLNDRLSE